MPYTKIQPQSFLSSVKGLNVFLPYMVVAVIMFNGTERFEQIPEGPKWNLVQICQAVSEKTFKDYIVYKYIYRPEARTDKLEGGGANFWLYLNSLTTLIIHCKFQS